MLNCVTALGTVSMVLLTGAADKAIVWSTTMMDWRKWWWEFSSRVNSSPWYVSFCRGSFAVDYSPQKR